MATMVVGTGEWLRELREAKGLAPEEMPMAMRKAGIDRRNIPSYRTIYRAEAGTRPIVRHRFGLAQFFDVPMAQLWPPEVRS